jgi:hypothetical protein
MKAMKKLLPLSVLLLIMVQSVTAQINPWAEKFFQLEWLVCGAFPNYPNNNSADYSNHEKRCWGFDNDFLIEHGGESAIIPKAGMTHTFQGVQKRWVKETVDFPIVDFHALFGKSDNSVAYAFCEIEVPDIFGGILSLGSDDGVKVWVNGEQVHENHLARGVKRDDDIIIVHFTKGTNRILVKVDNDVGGFGFVMRIGVNEEQKVQIMESGKDNCSGTSTGMIPLCDLGKDFYKGFMGGLYPEGTNDVPLTHIREGKMQSERIIPLDKNGLPSEKGKIVLVSFGMSNTTMEFSAFIKRVGQNKNRQLEIIDGAVGGRDITAWADPENNVWQMLLEKLEIENLSVNQVQVAWSKHALAGPSGTFPESTKVIQIALEKIAQNAIEFFPNLKCIFWSSRIYAGYASTNLNPEPFAYETGFAVKWMIEKQIEGDAMLSIKEGKAPWLGWGPYLWADGLSGRKDGLVWKCTDLRKNEGTHPSEEGRQKVAKLLEEFFRTNELTISWFIGDS